MSFVVGAPPASPIWHALNDGWTREAHLLANLQEQWAGLVHMQQRHSRPGVTAEDIRATMQAAQQAQGGNRPNSFQFDAMEEDEFDLKMAQRYVEQGADAEELQRLLGVPPERATSLYEKVAN